MTETLLTGKDVREAFTAVTAGTDNFAAFLDRVWATTRLGNTGADPERLRAGRERAAELLRHVADRPLDEL